MDQRVQARKLGGGDAETVGIPDRFKPFYIATEDGGTPVGPFPFDLRKWDPETPAARRMYGVYPGENQLGKCLRRKRSWEQTGTADNGDGHASRCGDDVGRAGPVTTWQCMDFYPVQGGNDPVAGVHQT